MKIGFIGQGWIGRNYADDFESRGFEIIRYSLEDEFISNKEAVSGCDIVFIAVPTPTTPDGFDDSIVRSAVGLVGEGNIAVIKSTLVPGTTEKIQLENNNIFIFHSPEFLVEKTAAYDAAHPQRNIIGTPIESPLYREKAESILKIMPSAPYSKIMLAKEAELIKYAGNCFLTTKVVYMNLVYDLVDKLGADWNTVREALVKDTRIGESHTQPVFDSGRGAGGHCFIKDFEAMINIYDEASSEDEKGLNFLKSIRDKNLSLLINSRKDIDLLKGVYGEDIVG